MQLLAVAGMVEQVAGEYQVKRGLQLQLSGVADPVVDAERMTQFLSPGQLDQVG